MRHPDNDAAIPVHPTYGALQQLARELDQSLRDGYFTRPGHVAALAWFVTAYQEARPASGAVRDTPDEGAPLA